MDFHVPDWLDQKFLAKVLKDEEGKDVDVEVVRFSVEPAMAPGNNYLSYMYRVRVEYKTSSSDSNKTVSLMVKVPFTEGFMKELSEQHNFFEKEPIIYTRLLPSLYKVTFCDFGPKSLNCLMKNVLVMKDLKEEGYLLVDKTKQLDFFHCEAVLKTLAKFHAASVVCSNINEELIKEVGVDHVFVEGHSIEKMAKTSIRNCLKTVTADPADVRFARFADLLVKRYDQIWSSVTKLTKPKPDRGFNVLNHGDLWTNNILFKYNNSGEVVDVKFIDYQISRFSSPVNDLVYFIWTSTTEEVRGKRQKELFGIYLTTLNKTLAALGSDERLSVQELNDDLSRSVDYTIMIISCSLAIMLASPEDVPDFANMTDEDFETEKFHMLFKGKTYNKLFPKYIEQVTEFFLDNKNMAGQSE